MRADRLLSTILLLQARGRVTGRELARRLEVSARTVHRDMDALSAAGVPIFALRGSRGGWQLDENWRTQVPGLEEAELRALLMAQPRVIGDSRLAAAAERAIGKLMAALPGRLRDQASSMRERLYVDPTAWRGMTEDLTLLPVVQEAVTRDRKLKMKYWRAGKERVDRIVDPLGLVAKGPAWYLVANTKRGFRTYRVSRIEAATILDRPARRPAGFDLASFWRSSTERFRDSWPRIEVTLRIEPGAAKLMKMWHTPLEEEQVENEGWVRMRVRFDHEEEARFVVLGMGPKAELLEPENLRAKVVADVLAMAKKIEPKK